MKKLPLQEPFHVALGGTPQSMNNLIQQDLQKFAYVPLFSAVLLSSFF